jgi:hypothetical protein
MLARVTANEHEKQPTEATVIGWRAKPIWQGLAEAGDRFVSENEKFADFSFQAHKLPVKLLLLTHSDRPSRARWQCSLDRKEGSTMRRYVAFGPWLPLAAALLCASCSGRGLNPVQGKVLYQGKAAKGAVVVFYPKGDESLLAIPATGVAGEDGTFTLSSGKDTGVVAGEYIVTITWPEEPKDPTKISMEAPPPPPDRLKGRYANRQSPALTATVKSGTNQLEPFDLR